MPNNRIPDGNESGLGTNAKGQVINKVTAKIGRHILRSLTLLFLTCVFAWSSGIEAHAQIWQNFKGVRLVNVFDSTTVLPINGTIFYNEQKTYPRFQVWENDTLKNLISDGRGGNFWPLSGVGTLTGDVTIDDDGNQITFDTHSSTVRVRSATDNNQYISLRPDGIVSTYDGIGNFFLLTSSGLNWGGAQEAQQTITSPTNVGHITFTNNSGNTTDIKGGQIKSTLLTDQTMLFSASNIITGENALSYNTSLNRILLSNTAGTFASSIFGGEIQLDDITNNDDVTFNNSGISVTGLATPYQIVSDGDIEINADNLTMQSTADMQINTGSDLTVSPGNSFDMLISGAGGSEFSLDATNAFLYAPSQVQIVSDEIISLSTFNNNVNIASGDKISLSGDIVLTPNDDAVTQLVGERYTPTLVLSGASNPVVSPNSTHYIRVGNEVSVTGVVTVDVGSGTPATVAFNLPIASALANSWDCAGMVWITNGGTPLVEQVTGDTTNDRPLIQWTPSVTGGVNLRYQFTYTVQ